MSYSKQNWTANDLVTSQKMNHIEQGIKEATDVLDTGSAYNEIGPVLGRVYFSDALPLRPAKLVVTIEPVQSGDGDPSPDNVRSISGWTEATVNVSPTTNLQDGITYSISWQSEVGTVYGGMVNMANGVLTVNRVMVDLGTLTWEDYDSAFDGYIARINDMAKASAGSLTLICSNYKEISARNSESYFGFSHNKTICYAAGHSFSEIMIQDDTYTTVTDFKNAMSGVQLVYKLATPITYQLIPPQVTLLQGDNSVLGNCGSTTVGYWRDDGLSINKAITERAYDRGKGEALSSAMTYVVNGNKSIETVSIPVGAYVRLVGSTIAGRSDGIYTVAMAIPVNTVIDGTYFNEAAPIPGGVANALNSESTYKANETQVGTWIDGKPIYRCIVSATLPNSKSYATIANIGNIDLLISSHFILETSTFCSDGAAYAGDDTSKINIGFVNKTGEVIYKNNVSNYFGSTVTAILEYTKP